MANFKYFRDLAFCTWPHFIVFLNKKLGVLFYFPEEGYPHRRTNQWDGGWGACNNIHMSIQLIEEVKHNNMELLAQRETIWQHQLRVYVEYGAKAHYYKKNSFHQRK